MKKVIVLKLLWNSRIPVLSVKGATTVDDTEEIRDNPVPKAININHENRTELDVIGHF